MRTTWPRMSREAWTVGAVALAIRLAIVLTVSSGYAGDMAGWVETTRRITFDGLHAAYAALVPGSLYPPAFFYPLWAAGHVYVLCCSPDFDTSTRALDGLMRVGPVLADAVLAVLVYALARSWSEPTQALWAGLLYAANPAVLTTVAWQGMIGDAYYGVLTVSALVAALSKRAALAAFCLTLGVLTKPQALAFIPLIAVLLLRCASWRRMPAAVGASVLTTLAVLLPFALGGTLGDVWSAVQGMDRIHAYTQNSADNFWMLLSPGQEALRLVNPDGGVPDDGILAAGLSYEQTGLLAFAALYVATLVRMVWTGRPREVALGSAVIGLGFFFLNTRMHVNYAFMAFPFLCALAPTSKAPLRAVLLAATIACLIDWDVFGRIPSQMHRVNAVAYGLSFVGLCIVAFQPRAWRRVS